MAIRPQGRKRSLSKKVSSFNMYMDQVYQIRTIMEATGAVKDAPIIRELLDEALGARRRKAMGLGDAHEPPGQETAETLHTIQTLLLKLIRRGERVFRNQKVGLEIMRETFVEARAGREGAFDALEARPWVEKGKSKETMANYFDAETRRTQKYVDGVIDKIRKQEAEEYNAPK